MLEHRQKVGRCDDLLNDVITNVRKEYLEKPAAFIGNIEMQEKQINEAVKRKTF